MQNQRMTNATTKKQTKISDEMELIMKHNSGNIINTIIQQVLSRNVISYVRYSSIGSYEARDDNGKITQYGSIYNGEKSAISGNIVQYRVLTGVFFTCIL